MRCLLLFWLIASLLMPSVAKAQLTTNAQREVNYLKDSISSTTSDSLSAHYRYQIANVYYLNRNSTPHWYDSAFKYNHQSIELAAQKKLTNLLGRAQRLACTMLLAIGQHEKAVAGLDRLEDVNAIQTYRNWADAYAGTGFAYIINIDSAIYFFKKALAMSERINHTYRTAQALVSIGFCYIRKSDTTSAKAYATKATALLGEQHEDIAFMWYNYGTAPP